MKKLWTAAIVVSTALLWIVLAQAATTAFGTTYTYPILWPKSASMTGWQTFPSGDPVVAITNDKQLEASGLAPEASGLEAVGMYGSEIFNTSYTIPQGSKVRSATLHVYGAGAEGALEAIMAIPGSTTSLSILGAGSWAQATKTFIDTPIQGSEWIGSCYRNTETHNLEGEYSEHETHYLRETEDDWLYSPQCQSRQTQMEHVSIALRMSKWSKTKGVQAREAYIRLEVESP